MSLPTNVDPVELDTATLQNYQSIYENLTNRSERRLTFKSDRHRVSTDHILNLHKQIDQTAHTMNVLNSSMYITQRSADDTSERWSAIEKFKIHSKTIPEVTTEIEIVYYLLIKLPHAERPGQYKITIGLRNSLYDLDKQRQNPESLDPVDVLMMSKMATARWEIEFTDMSVARTFSHAISAWYDALPRHPVPLAEKVSKYSKSYVPAVVRVISALIISFTAFGSAIWTQEPMDSGRIAVFILLMYGAHFATTPLISRLNKKLMCIRTAASLNITSPDKDLLNEDEQKRGRLAKWIWANALLPQLPAALIFAFKYLRTFL